MKKETFVKNIEKLEAAFNKDLKRETVEVYWDYLKDFTDEDFEGKCREIIMAEKWFPSISVFFQKSENDDLAYQEELLAGAI